jgi:ADP-heptose:LPS heptosyltransferase
MVIRNPKLSVGFEISNQYKIFKKYAVIHIDKRPQPGRNIYGIDWGLISDILKSKGFLVIQLGKGDHDKIDGAIEMNTVNESLLSYVVGGADLFIGIDSGISHIASAHNIPSIIMFGSVNPEFIHPINNGNKIFIHNHDKKVCDKPFCWHTVIGCEGIQCYIDKENPPCSKFNNLQVLNAVEKLCN